MEEAIPVTGGATNAKALPGELVDNMLEIASLVGRPWVACLPNPAISLTLQERIRIRVG